MATEFLAFKTRTIWPDVKFAVLFSVANVMLCIIQVLSVPLLMIGWKHWNPEQLGLALRLLLHARSC